MKQLDIFEYSDYKAYLKDVFPKKGLRTGKRSALASFIGCQTAYVSQVFNGSADFNLEQAFRVNSFIGHNDTESQAFLLLVQIARAGNHDYKAYLHKNWLDLKNKSLDLKRRIESTVKVSDEVQSQYYSCWYYVAIHMLLSIDNYQTREAIVEHLKLDINTVSKVLDFLVHNGMAEEDEGVYTIGDVHIHLGRDSQQIFKHQNNMRSKAIQSLDHMHERDNIHYSVLYSLSEEDAQKIQTKITQLIEENLKIIAPSEP